MDKRGVTVLLLILVLVLSSCRGNVNAGDNPQSTEAVLQAVQTGSQGVEITTLPRMPPDLIYDQNELTALVEVRNRGNYDLDPQSCFIQITGFDTNIIPGWENSHICTENAGSVLEGKNVYNLNGGFNQIEFRSTNVNLPNNVFEYKPTLNVIACYNYHTKANPQVCVDPQTYQVTSEQKTCQVKNVGMGGGQGAPVGVTSVNVNMVGTKAVFEINIANLGTGRVLSPDSALQNCGSSNLEYRDLDKVKYDVKLSGGGSLIDCKPRDHSVLLYNNAGKIVCSFNIPMTSAYETPLMIELDYNYIQSFLKPIRIIKTPQ